jgi:DNA-binding NtrC family response regulator
MTKQSILIVDDEELLRLSLKFNMEREGFEVDTADSAESGLAILKERSYNLLLIDYLMEQVNGIELMQQARELYPELKVIIISGYGTKKLADEIRRLGANDFICKPIDFNDLLERISNTLNA